MRLREFRLLTDENVHPGVVAFLRDQRFDVLDVKESGLAGATDKRLLSTAYAEDRLVITHDSDFGTLAVLAAQPAVGIIYLRPGHIKAEFTIDMLRVLLKQDPDLQPPFILVADRTGHRLSIRFRPL